MSYLKKVKCVSVGTGSETSLGKECADHQEFKKKLVLSLPPYYFLRFSSFGFERVYAHDIR